MTDCTNETMRDLLPELAHDALSAEESARVRAHVALCASCAVELEVIRTAGKLFAQATPAIDTAAVVRALPAAPTSRPVLTLERTTRRRFAIPRYALAAAASLLVVASLALPAIFGGKPVPNIDVALDSNPVAVSAPVAILGASALGDLESDELESLLAALETMEATVSAEPIDRQPITSTPEGI
jgi:hypothetical protein